MEDNVPAWLCRDWRLAVQVLSLLLPKTNKATYKAYVHQAMDQAMANTYKVTTYKTPVDGDLHC